MAVNAIAEAFGLAWELLSFFVEENQRLRHLPTALAAKAASRRRLPSQSPIRSGSYASFRMGNSAEAT